MSSRSRSTFTVAVIGGGEKPKGGHLFKRNEDLSSHDM
jgi:hypothetical protein